MNSITKHISFPPPLFASIETQAKRFGLSIAEYIRYLAIMDIRERELQEKMSVQKWEHSLPEYEISQGYWNILDTAKDDMQELSIEAFKNR